MVLNPYATPYDDDISRFRSGVSTGISLLAYHPVYHMCLRAFSDLSRDTRTPESAFYRCEERFQV